MNVHDEPKNDNGNLRGPCTRKFRVDKMGMDGMPTKLGWVAYGTYAFEIDHSSIFKAYVREKAVNSAQARHVSSVVVRTGSGWVGVGVGVSMGAMFMKQSIHDKRDVDDG